MNDITVFFSVAIVISITAFLSGYMVGNEMPPIAMTCATTTPICEDQSAYYISYIDSNYEIKCPVKPQITIKDTNIGGWE